MTTTPTDTDQAAPVLFPCPFCGGNNVRVFGPIGWYRQFGISHSCQAFHGGSGDFTVGAHSREEAIRDWNRRADLAAPSAPAEVEGLEYAAIDAIRLEAFRTNDPDTKKRFLEAAGRWFQYETCRAMDRATALTALQAALVEKDAEIERLRVRLRQECNLGLNTLERAEKAEAHADQLADALHHMVNASIHPDQMADEALAAHAKLRGEAWQRQNG